jgi:hypothetical protein
VSYARPGKLFTANDRFMLAEQGMLKPETLKQIVAAVVDVLQTGLKV